jgi:hypothetical protein
MILCRMFVVYAIRNGHRRVAVAQALGAQHPRHRHGLSAAGAG